MDHFKFVHNVIRTKKIWVCLFTCMTTQAIHLELVAYNSTTQFLLAFRRFTSCRGAPSNILSANAPNFKLCREVLINELRQISENKVVKDFSTNTAVQIPKNISYTYNSIRESLNTFWDIWHKEYLRAIAERNQIRLAKRRSSSRLPQIGDNVLIEMDNTGRSQWSLGVVLELNKSSDGAIRVFSDRFDMSRAVQGQTHRNPAHGAIDQQDLRHETALQATKEQGKVNIIRKTGQLNNILLTTWLDSFPH
ncbi:unnamed protein product [Heligmosomoides polygyrus]|uniref:DUF5641 domain-containing protein n=1 Tax=Heligmosomoides polygyrus TaxID=6339 RepID=A0A3P8DPJ4_HELPZ|nr:unnamed protein product [Heligmosomoides polygyrus]